MPEEINGIKCYVVLPSVVQDLNAAEAGFVFRVNSPDEQSVALIILASVILFRLCSFTTIFNFKLV